MVRVIQEKNVYPNSQEVVRSVVRRKRAKGVLLGTPIFKGKVDKLRASGHKRQESEGCVKDT